MKNYQEIIARELGITVGRIAATTALLNDGATVPFIARYRKEATGSLDEVQIAAVRDRLSQLTDLDKRRESMTASLSERGLLTGELAQSLKAARDMTALEDIYLPYRPKRRTRSSIAMGKGLEPLARALFEQKNDNVNPGEFVNPADEVFTAEEALSGARDIMAEWINEDAVARSGLRKLFVAQGIIQSTVVKKNQEKGAKFRDYFSWEEPVKKVPGHRILAMLRGEEEKVLRLSIRPPENEAHALLQCLFVKTGKGAGEQVEIALQDSYLRLLGPSLENECRATLKERADREAIQVFADNLRELLLAPPLGRKRVLALDPGFKSGAKLVCLDEQGKLLYFSTIFPTLSARQQQEAGKHVEQLCEKYNIEAIIIGNGTAGRETEAFVRALNLPSTLLITMVDESGASIYSASEVARDEFPDHDITVRGAVSIGRRSQDPLAELVKLDPKAIGVGQYQHDVNQTALKKSLEDVVISCVNNVGVDLNSASRELLIHVSGLGPVLAGNIVAYRNENGSLKNRRQLLQVPRLGAKAFEQCAGFLRIKGGENPLDGSAVHPEHYGIVKQMARDCGCAVEELMAHEAIRKKIDVQRYVNDSVGLPTLQDIMAELAKPGRDPRSSFTEFAFAAGVNSIDDLQTGMKLPGIVTNVTKFGAFVDIGVHQDGLIHISQLADRFVKDPADVVKVRQQVVVRLLDIDIPRKRISLSLRDV